jgi:hypothetical protein
VKKQKKTKPVSLYNASKPFLDEVYIKIEKPDVVLNIVTETDEKESEIRIVEPVEKTEKISYTVETDEEADEELETQDEEEAEAVTAAVQEEADAEDGEQEAEEAKEAEEAEEAEEEEDEDDEGDEYMEVTINGVTYYTTDEQNGKIYAITEDEDIGDLVGQYKNGKAVMNKK